MNCVVMGMLPLLGDLGRNIVDGDDAVEKHETDEQKQPQSEIVQKRIADLVDHHRLPQWMQTQPSVLLSAGRRYYGVLRPTGTAVIGFCYFLATASNALASVALAFFLQ